MSRYGPFAPLLLRLVCEKCGNDYRLAAGFNIHYVAEGDKLEITCGCCGAQWTRSVETSQSPVGEFRPEHVTKLSVVSLGLVPKRWWRFK